MKKRILIVDDQPFHLHVLARILKDDYEVNIADNGHQCIELSKAIHPDLILLDVVMKGIDGYETCTLLKASKDTQDIPIIFLTAKTQTQEIVRGLELGGCDYISKNFEPEVLKARIRTHIRIAEHKAQLQKQSNTDTLTEIANRKHFDESLALEWDACLIKESPLSLILFDIDHFKEYNDFYGHTQGDKTLKRIARTLSEHCKTQLSSTLCRFGGEEFALILPHTPQQKAYMLAETIRLKLKEQNIPHIHSTTSHTVTLSIGIATLSPCPLTHPDTLIQKADEALYTAKARGRNQSALF